MKIKTEILQNMVSKVIQGASFNKMIPLTSLIGIEFKEDSMGGKGNLILTTTDGSNQLKINQEVEGTGEFYTIVNADTFAKLVGKTTKEFIELENKENYLEVKGNGDYKLEIAINEEGEMVRFPDIPNLQGTELSINLKELQEAIKVSKASIAKTMEIPCLTGYYIGKNTITTDRQLICKLDKELITEPILISSEMAELLLLVEGDEILELIIKDNEIEHFDIETNETEIEKLPSDLIFYNANYTLYGKELEGKELYPEDKILNLDKLEYTDSVKVNKQELLNVLDRMSLFVSDYDKNGVFLSFTKEGLIVRSQKSNAEEIIAIDTDANKELKEITCLIDIEMLKSEVEVVSTDNVEIYYGQDKMIKIVDGNTTFVLSLLDKVN